MRLRNKQQCLFTNLWRDFTGFVTTIIREKLNLSHYSLKQFFQAVFDYMKNITIFNFVSLMFQVK